MTSTATTATPTASTPTAATTTDLGSPTPLAGRTAVVTGSTSGIGAAIARKLAANGAHVVVSGRDAERADGVVDEIRSAGGRADFVAVDLAGTYDDIRQFVTAATEVLGGGVDILVNNAGIYPATATTDLPDDDLDAMLAVNIRAPHVLVAALVPGMIAHGRGVIVNIGSWMAQVGSPMAAMYTATKAADEQLARTWAAEYGRRGVRVNSVAPGVTLTPGNEAYRTVLDQMTASTPAGSVVSTDDIADAVMFLVSDWASMIHGVTLYVDGGISSTRPVGVEASRDQT
jgi:NAD(P)-dependent dehydrogenase (short-subunit alcohol dehydrogenase family)